MTVVNLVAAIAQELDRFGVSVVVTLVTGQRFEGLPTLVADDAALLRGRVRLQVMLQS